MIAEGFASNDLVILNNGSIYITDPQSKRIWHVDSATGQSNPVDRFDGCKGSQSAPTRRCCMWLISPTASSTVIRLRRTGV